MDQLLRKWYLRSKQFVADGNKNYLRYFLSDSKQCDVTFAKFCQIVQVHLMNTDLCLVHRQISYSNDEETKVFFVQ
jgi:hypothetical protein